MLLGAGIMRVEVSQETAKRGDLGEFVGAPKAPDATSEDGKEREDKHRSIEIGHEEGLGVGVVGEDGLEEYRRLAHRSVMSEEVRGPRNLQMSAHVGTYTSEKI